MQIVQTVANRVLANVQKVIIGKQNEVRMTLVALLCEGHLLIDLQRGYVGRQGPENADG